MRVSVSLPVVGCVAVGVAGAGRNVQVLGQGRHAGLPGHAVPDGHRVARFPGRPRHRVRRAGAAAARRRATRVTAPPPRIHDQVDCQAGRSCKKEARRPPSDAICTRHERGGGARARRHPRSEERRRRPASTRVGPTCRTPADPQTVTTVFSSTARSSTSSARSCRQVRALVQRVREASVTVDGRITGEIGRGLLVLAGVTAGDER